MSLASPVLADRFFTTGATLGSPPLIAELGNGRVDTSTLVSLILVLAKQLHREMYYFKEEGLPETKSKGLGLSFI